MAESQDSRRKVYVKVLVMHGVEGEKKPVSIIFEDGKKYEIDRVCAVQRAAAGKVGGTGIRYQIRIQGHMTYLFEDEDRWFVEARCIHQ